MSRVIFLVFILVFGPALAQEGLPKPNGKVLLTVSGAVTRTNGPGKAQFDRDMLLELGFHKLRTSTPWTDGTPEFEGVLARDLMAAVGARGREVKAQALNEYVVVIPLPDFERYPVILALSMNGKTLTRRDKGPLWVVYPLDDIAQLQRSNLGAQMIWQLEELEVR
jgi:hypothetical protein|tara:strand:+ start:52 stop:549 length:498 start_codon:yes stop_codon:yes gene_type:complete